MTNQQFASTQKIRHPIKLNWQESVAYSASIAAISGGLYLSKVSDPAWMGRAGSLVIVCGVLLGFSRKVEILLDEARLKIAEHQDKHFPTVIHELEKEGEQIPQERINELKTKVYNEVDDELLRQGDNLRRILKLHEIILVVAGTLVNGFGEWAIKASSAPTEVLHASITGLLDGTNAIAKFFQ